MALTDKEAAQRAFVYFQQRGRNVDANFIARAMAIIPDALELLGKRLASSDDYKLLQKTFSPVTISAGVTDLSTQSRILFNPLRATVYPPSSLVPARWVWDVDTLKHGGLLNDAIYYTEQARQLIFLNTDGATDTLAGAGKVVANFIPLITEVPVECEGAFMAALVDLCGDLRGGSTNADNVPTTR